MYLLPLRHLYHPSPDGPRISHLFFSVENYLDRRLAIVSYQTLGLADELLKARSVHVALSAVAVFIFLGGIMMLI